MVNIPQCLQSPLIPMFAKAAVSSESVNQHSSQTLQLVETSELI